MSKHEIREALSAINDRLDTIMAQIEGLRPPLTYQPWTTQPPNQIISTSKTSGGCPCGNQCGGVTFSNG